MNKAFKDSQEHDLYIKPHAPIADVLKIEFDPLLHFFQFVSFTAPTVNLRPARNPRFNFMTQHI